MIGLEVTLCKHGMNGRRLLIVDCVFFGRNFVRGGGADNLRRRYCNPNDIPDIVQFVIYCQRVCIKK